VLSLIPQLQFLDAQKRPTLIDLREDAFVNNIRYCAASIGGLELLDHINQQIPRKLEYTIQLLTDQRVYVVIRNTSR